jgi:hypothetical protein
MTELFEPVDTEERSAEPERTTYALGEEFPF